MSKFNQWFLGLPEGRKEVLRADKWLMADAAFNAREKELSDLSTRFTALMQQNNTLAAENERLSEKLAAMESEEPYVCASLNGEDFSYSKSHTETFVGHGWKPLCEHPPVPADKPAVAVPGGWPTAEMIVIGAEHLHDRLRQCGFVFDDDNRCATTDQQNIVESVFVEMLAAAPSHSQQSAKRITECDARALCYAFLDYYDEEDDADFDTWLSSGGQALLDELGADRCPSHESEQSIDDLPGMWDESDLSGGWADSCNQQTEGE